MKHFLNNGVPIFCNFIDRDNSGLIFTKKKKSASPYAGPNCGN